MSMARKDWKQPISLSLSKDVLKLLREAETLSDVSRSSIVETAILYWHANKFDEWKRAFQVRGV